MVYIFVPDVRICFHYGQIIWTICVGKRKQKFLWCCQPFFPKYPTKKKKNDYLVTVPRSLTTNFHSTYDFQGRHLYRQMPVPDILHKCYMQVLLMKGILRPKHVYKGLTRDGRWWWRRRREICSPYELSIDECLPKDSPLRQSVISFVLALT